MRRKTLVTIAPVKAGDTSGLEPEFGRVPDVQRLFGLRRGTQYNLLASGKIRGVLLRATGEKSGIRLISIPSVREYIARQMQEAA